MAIQAPKSLDRLERFASTSTSTTVLPNSPDSLLLEFGVVMTWISADDSRGLIRDGVEEKLTNSFTF